MMTILFKSKKSLGYSEFEEVCMELRKVAELIKAWLLGGRSFREMFVAYL